jgi:regulatory protein
MPLVTRVRERRGRVRVFIDDEFWAEIDANVASERGIFEGAEPSPEELDVARVEGEKALAMSRALNLLGYRPRSEKEIRDRLRRFGHSDEAVEAVVARLRDLEYLDDEEFARVMAREKARKYGPRRVAMELRRAGVGHEATEEAVEEEFGGRSEFDDAREAASRRYNTGERSDAEARRVYGFLTRRGYSATVCSEVAKEYR